jgi:hypothetical protein
VSRKNATRGQQSNKLNPPRHRDTPHFQVHGRAAVCAELCSLIIIRVYPCGMEERSVPARPSPQSQAANSVLETLPNFC